MSSEMSLEFVDLSLREQDATFATLLLLLHSARQVVV